MLFDRHFFTDYYATDINGKGPEKTIYSKRSMDFVLKRFYPRPNMVIVLDAAKAEVIFARKGEGTIELLERCRCRNICVAERPGRVLRRGGCAPDRGRGRPAM